MNTYSIEYYCKSFRDASMKEAYLKACKWVSTNVISKDELSGSTLVKYEKESRQSQLPTITVHLYAVVNETEIRDRHCNICKETHNAFFLNKSCDCNKCNVNAFHRRADEVLKRKKDFCIDKLGVN